MSKRFFFSNLIISAWNVFLGKCTLIKFFSDHWFSLSQCIASQLYLQEYWAIDLIIVLMIVTLFCDRDLSNNQIGGSIPKNLPVSLQQLYVLLGCLQRNVHIAIINVIFKA